MLIAILLGVGFGVGVLLLASAVVPKQPSLAAALAVLTGPSSPPPVEVDSALRPAAWWRRAVSAVADQVDRGRWGPGLGRQLRLVGDTPEAFVVRLGGATLYGMLLMPAMAALLTLAGVDLPLVIPVAAAPAGGVLFFAAVLLSLRQRVERARAEMRHAVGVLVDLVAIALAGPLAVEQALREAAARPGSWAFQRLRAALTDAELLARTPWQALDELGAEYGIDDLRELAASIELAGEDGAQVRASLATKAASMRAHELAAQETEATAATENMSIPSVLLIIGYVIFLGYPPLASAISNL